ncbi:hypothetical protein HED55_17420 [Ochrobactrum haematophilum]|uniref:Uncharacterized protein n=1 Tax=Brucella haematophila TaxID=419474 RepID=A0ABX1DQK0_9HYPH|nr:hypothetical protein [Brucella haematophila]
MEAAFIKRGQAVVERLYPDPIQRRTLYQIGFTPFVGRQFQQVSPQINAALKEAVDYGRRSPEARFTLFGRSESWYEPVEGSVLLHGALLKPR